MSDRITQGLRDSLAANLLAIRDSADAMADLLAGAEVIEPPAATPPSETGGPMSSWVAGGAGPVLSDSSAASKVRRSAWEPASRGNASANLYVPSDAELADFRAENQQYDPWAAHVTGRPGIPAPTTDELIQWAAWKWGLDEMLLRAQASHESDWRMSAVGDAGMSFGIMQIKDHRPDLSPVHPGTHPLSERSTAFNLDWACGFLRYIRVNKCPFESGMLSWYWSGNSCSVPAYVASVQERLAQRTWLTYG